MRVEHDEVDHHAAPPPVVVRREQLPQRRQPVRRVDASRAGSASRRRCPCAQSSGCEPRLRRSSSLRCAQRRAAGRADGRRDPGTPRRRRRDVQLAQLDLRRASTRGRARAARRADRDSGRRARTRARASSATSVVNATDADCPGASRTRARSAKIGSSTAPVVPESAPSRVERQRDRACVRPRPMKRARSVSQRRPSPTRSAPGVDDVRAPERALGRRARPPRGGDRRAPLVPLGLDEQVRERRVRAVGVRRREHDLAVARELDLARRRGRCW